MCIEDDYNEEVCNIRKKLVDYMFEARRRGEHAVLIRDKVIEMQQMDFLDFAVILKHSLVVRKVNGEKEKFLWNSVRWVRYTKTYGKVLYKNSHEGTGGFHELNFRRRGVTTFSGKVKCCYIGQNPISQKKKKDLLDLLQVLDLRILACIPVSVS